MQISSTPAALKNDARFINGQKQLEANHRNFPNLDPLKTEAFQ
jgi:hypothetical protein